MKSRVWMAGLLAVVMSGASALTIRAEDPQSPVEKAPAASATYSCPMHPQIQATFPGSCPVCRMALKPKGTSEAEPAPTNHVDHAHQGTNMGGMDMGMMNCPHCMMGMGGMGGMATKAAPAVPAASGKIAPTGYRRAVGGRRCGC